ncbi:MAG: hypothetical protein JSS20_13800, partial [Proteobacteria bacterium]|nr:hypothetical protein [Pseudomonadota bacterium]
MVAAGDPVSLAEAIALYRGPFLADTNIREESWIEWQELRRRNYETSVVDAMVALSEYELAAGRAEAARKLAASALDLDAYREDALRLELRALVSVGRTADALQRYADFADTLQREVGGPPDPRTSDLADELRSKGARSQSSAAPPSDLPKTSAKRKAEINRIVDGTLNSGAEHPARLAVVDRSPAGDILSAVAGTVTSTGVPLDVRIVGRTLLVETGSTRLATELAFRLRGKFGRRETAANESPISMALETAQSDQKRDTVAAADLAQHVDSDKLIATDEAREHLVDGLDASVEDLGIIKPRGLSIGVRAFALEPAGYRPALVSPLNGMRFAPLIAILPFSVAGTDGVHAALAELLAEETIEVASRSMGVDVVSRLSTRLLASRTPSLHDFAQHLHANYATTGRIAREGSKFRLAIELTDVATGIVKCHAIRVFDLSAVAQVREAAQWICLEIMAAIFRAETQHVASRPMESLEAYSLLFAAVTLMDRWTRSAFERSADLLHVLLERAPRHPLPNAWLAAWHVRSISQGWTVDRAADGRRAREFAMRSLDADPYCSIALAMDGWVDVYAGGRLDSAVEKLSTAVTVNPSDSLAWLLKAVAHSFSDGGAEAIEAAERALRLSPLDPRLSYYQSMSATAALSAGAYQRAVDLAESSLRANRLHISTL